MLPEGSCLLAIMDCKLILGYSKTCLMSKKKNCLGRLRFTALLNPKVIYNPRSSGFSTVRILTGPLCIASHMSTCHNLNLHFSTPLPGCAVSSVVSYTSVCHVGKCTNPESDCFKVAIVAQVRCEVL